ncbi:MAG: tetratricopeptide repeat protein [Hyphomicrobiaceae bacterium]
MKLDPNYSEALAALAVCIGRLTIGGWMAGWGEGGAEARDIALQAVRADPENGTALSIAAWAIGSFTGPLEQGVDLARQALRAHPNSAVVRTNCSWVFVCNNERDLALEHLHAARRISPLDPRGYITLNAIAAAHFCERRFDETVL